MKDIVPIERIENKILLIRGQKVMLDRDLAELYGISTKRLKEQVKRNIMRFPKDFMFELTKEELGNWRSQFATSNREKMGIRRPPFVFTEHGAVMLASVLNSPTAVTVSIQIVRTFIHLREILSSHKKLAQKLEKMESKYDTQFQVVFKAIKKLMQEEEKPQTRIGFKVSEDGD